MSKAEDLALEKYPSRSVLVVPARGGGYYADSHLREGFIEGYHQAEKDLELTWKDMMAIDDLLDELSPPRRDSDELVLCGYYQEVLKRFKEGKRSEKDNHNM